MSDTTSTAYKRRLLFSNLWEHRWLCLSVIALSLCAAAFESVGLGLLIPFLQGLTDPAAESFRTGWEWFDTTVLAVGASQMTRLYRISAFILVSIWIKGVFSYFAELQSISTREAILRDVRLQVFDQLQAVALSFYATMRTGSIVNTLNGEVQRLREAIAIIFRVAVRSFVMMAYVVALFWISWQMTLLVGFFFGALSAGLTRMMRWITERGREVVRANRRFTTQILETISGIRTIKAFGTEAYERRQFMKANNNLSSQILRLGRRRLLVNPAMQTASASILVVMIIVAVKYFILPGHLDPALLLAFMFALFRLMPMVREVNQARSQWAATSPALEAVAELLDRSDKPYLTDGHRTFEGLRQGIRFEHVDFAYEPDEPVLKNINATIEAGTTVAIVGASGAGKSTMVDLIPRFFDPDAGRIVIDGYDLREYRMDSLRKRMAIVSQETFLFHGTVLENIAYGVDVSMEDVYRAAEQANAIAFIEELPNGFDTILGERGMRLSGGQRQRIAIARALLRNPDILILDEATSALDSISEKLVQSALERLLKDRTVIVIAHRLSTVENADQVIVLEEGCVVEQGSYHELLEQRGQLWKYHSIQFQLA